MMGGRINYAIFFNLQYMNRSYYVIYFLNPLLIHSATFIVSEL